MLAARGLSRRRLLIGTSLLPALWLINRPVSAQRPLRLLMLLWRGETAAEQGLLSALEHAAIPLEITRIDAGQDRERLAAALWKLAPDIDRFDAVYSFGTTASVMTRGIVRGRIPQLYSMVSNPQAAGLVARPGNAPLTGSTDAIAASTRLRLAQQLFQIERIGFLFNAREQNAREQLEEVQALVDEQGLQLEVLRVAPEGNSLEHQLQRLRDGNIAIDTLYLPSDSYVISRAPAIMAALTNQPIRVVAATAGMVDEGALLAVAPDYRAMGEELAQRLIQLYRGEAIELEPIKVREPRLLYNSATATRLGIQLPAALFERLEARP